VGFFGDIQMPDPSKNTSFNFSISLINSTNRPEFAINPTISTGDFQVSIDGGNYSNLNTTPVVTPAGSKTVLISLLASEMNGDVINILGVSSGSHWDDILISINTSINTIDSGLSLATNSISDSTYSRIRGTVQSNISNSANQFQTNLSSSIDNAYINCICKFTSGVLSGQVQFVTGYIGTTKILTFLIGFTSLPSTSDSFDLINF